MNTIHGTVAGMLAACALQLVQKADDGAAKATPVGADPMLTVCQDEKSLEMQYRNYIRARYGITADIGTADRNDDDVILRYRGGSGDDVPELRIDVDTLISAKGPDGKITERVIRITAVHALPAAWRTEQGKLKVLGFNNAMMRERWAPDRITVDDAGNIMLETSINIPGPEVGVHADMVHDSIKRLCGSWGDYWRGLQEVMTL